MEKTQRFKYEMFVRVRDFGIAHAALFPAGSKGSEAMARVTAAVAEIKEHQKQHLLGQAEARRVKATTREAVFDYLKTIAAAARRLTQVEPGVTPFRLPRRRGLAAELAAARLFIDEAVSRQAAFERFGLPPTFLDDFRARVRDLEQAADVRISSKTVRRRATAGIRTALAQGLEAARDLDVFVAIATREDPTSMAAWTSARRIEGFGTGAPKTPATPPVELAVAEPLVSGPNTAVAAASPTAPVAAPPTSPEVGELEKAS